MSNYLVLSSDKVIPKKFWDKHKCEINSLCGNCLSYFVEYDCKSIGLNEPELIKYTYKLKSHIYFELEKENKKVKEIYTDTKKLLLWLHNLVNELINDGYVIKLIKVNYGNNDDFVVYEQNIDLSYLLQENVVFDSYVIYCIS